MITTHSMRLLLAAGAVCGVCTIAGAQDTVAAATPDRGVLPVPDYTGGFMSRTHLLGDLNGSRTQLAEKGAQAAVNWTQVAQSIASGGRDEDKAYGGNVDVLIHLDLMRMGVLDGGLITIRTESRYGESVNGAAGPILPVNTDGFFPLAGGLDEGICITITNLNYTQFLSEQFAVFAGKIDTLDGDANEFASGRGTSQFMNANLVFNPVVALRLPYSTLGGGVLWLPTPNSSIKGTVFNTLDSSTTTGFNDFGDGITATAEATMQYRLGDLPGGMNLGGLYSFDQDFTKVNGKLIFEPGVGLVLPNEDATWAVYWSVWQYLFVEDPGTKPINLANGEPDHQGFGVFARLGCADNDTNPIEVAATCGIGGKGLIPGRDRDTFGIGYYFTGIQDTPLGRFARIDSQAQGGEAFYNIAITPAAHLTFDVQVADSPFPGPDTAVVLGMRLNLSF